MGKVVCGNCDWTGEQEQCKEVKDISMRVSAGEIMPAGECPECGALCNPREKFVFQNRDSLKTFSIESVNLDSAAAQLLFHIGWSSHPPQRSKSVTGKPASGTRIGCVSE